MPVLFGYELWHNFPLAVPNLYQATHETSLCSLPGYPQNLIYKQCVIKTIQQYQMKLKKLCLLLQSKPL
jgi:hypothetical protein